MDLPGHGKNLSKPLNSIKELSNLIKKLIKSLPNKSVELEAGLLRDHGITHICCKNSGGAFSQAKLQAARLLRLPVWMLARPTAPQAAPFYQILHDVDSVKQALARWSITSIVYRGKSCVRLGGAVICQSPSGAFGYLGIRSKLRRIWKLRWNVDGTSKRGQKIHHGGVLSVQLIYGFAPYPNGNLRLPFRFFPIRPDKAYSDSLLNRA